MKYKKIKIETDGTSAGTKIFIDDKQIGRVQRIEFSADINEAFARIDIQSARMYNGNVKTKKVKVRDEKSQKFIDKEKVETEQLVLKRNA